MKRIFIFICLSIYIFCSPQEMLDKWEAIHKEVKQEQSDFNKLFDRDSLLVQLGYNEDPSQELIFVIDSFLQRTALDLIEVDGCISSTDYSQIKSILEKAIIMERDLDPSEESFIQYFSESYLANYKLFSKKRVELAKKSILILNEEFMKYALLKNNFKPYGVEIGIPKKDNILSVEKKQNFITTKDSSITLLYSFDPIPPMTYYISFELLSPDGIRTKPEFPKIYKNEKISPFNWCWNFDVVSDLKNKKGKWTVFLIINDKEVNQSSFTLR